MEHGGVGVLDFEEVIFHSCFVRLRPRGVGPRWLFTQDLEQGNGTCGISHRCRSDDDRLSPDARGKVSGAVYHRARAGGAEPNRYRTR